MKPTKCTTKKQKTLPARIVGQFQFQWRPDLLRQIPRYRDAIATNRFRKLPLQSPSNEENRTSSMREYPRIRKRLTSSLPGFPRTALAAGTSARSASLTAESVCNLLIGSRIIRIFRQIISVFSVCTRHDANRRPPSALPAEQFAALCRRPAFLLPDCIHRLAFGFA